MKTIEERAQDYAKAKKPKSPEHRAKIAESAKRRWALAKAAYAAQQQKSDFIYPPKDEE